MGIFQKSVIQKHLSNLDTELVEKAFLKFREDYNLSLLTCVLFTPFSSLPRKGKVNISEKAALLYTVTASRL
jgi:hypothetical protein